MADQTEFLENMQENVESYVRDPQTNRKVIKPEKFTILDAQNHYNELKEAENVKTRQSKFNKGGKLKTLANITIAEIGEDPKKFINKVIKLAPNDKTRTTMFQSIRLILGETQRILPLEAEKLFEVLPTLEAEERQTLKFFNFLPSIPDKTFANLAIIDDNRTIKTFFDGLDDVAQKSPRDAVVVDAIKFGANTGVRPSLIEKLERQNVKIDPDNGRMFLSFNVETEGVKDSTTKGGGKKKLGIVRIPVNNEVEAILRERLLAADNVDLKKPTDKLFFIESATTKGVDNLKITPLKSTHINKVLGEVKVPSGLIEDLADVAPGKTEGKIYDSLHIDSNTRPKSGAQLLRNLHTHLAHKAGLDPHVIDFLQMRKSEQAIHQTLGYLTESSRSSFSSLYYDNLNKFDTYFDEIEVQQKIYPQGEEGLKAIQSNLNMVRSSIVDQGEINFQEVNAERAKNTIAATNQVKELVKTELGIVDTKAQDAIALRYRGVTGFTPALEFFKDYLKTNNIDMSQLPADQQILRLDEAVKSYDDHISGRSLKTPWKKVVEGATQAETELLSEAPKGSPENRALVERLRKKRAAITAGDTSSLDATYKRLEERAKKLGLRKLAVTGAGLGTGLLIEAADLAASPSEIGSKYANIPAEDMLSSDLLGAMESGARIEDTGELMDYGPELDKRFAAQERQKQMFDESDEDPVAGRLARLSKAREREQGYYSADPEFDVPLTEENVGRAKQVYDLEAEDEEEGRRFLESNMSDQMNEVLKNPEFRR